MLPFAIFAQPANDVCADAISVTPDGTCVSGTTVDAADNWQNVVGCQTGNNASNHPDVWYTFVATGTQADFTVTAGTFTGDIELILVEIDGTVCTDDLLLVGTDCGASPLTSTFTGLNPGGTYVYTISNTPTGTTGTFTSCLTNSSPPPVSGQDCGTAAILCDNSSFSQGSSTAGSGAVAGNTSDENLSAISCLLSDERQSLWYKFTVGCSGTLEFKLDPNDNTNDYDWGIFDITNTGCAITPGGSATGGSPVVACNYSGCRGNTGIWTGDPCAFLDNDCTQSPNDCISAQLQTTMPTFTAGNTYALLIDNFTLSNSGFSFEWGPNGTAVIGPDAQFSYTSPSCGVFDFTKDCQVPNSTFLWNFGDGNTSTSQNPSHTYLSSGVYFVSLEVTDALGCTRTYGESVEVNVPTATATPSSQTICTNETTAISLTSNVIGTTFDWTVAQVGVSGGADGSGSSIAQTLTATGVTAGTATYTVTPTAAGCVGAPISVVITVNPTPTATATSNSPVCVGQSLDLTGGAIGLTYSWSGPSSFSSTSQSPNVSGSATLAMAGDYILTVSDGTCSNTATATIVVNALPIANASDNGPLCEGDQLDLTGGDTGMTSYAWTGPNSYSNGTQSPSITNVTTTMAGTYTLTVNDGNCSNTATTTVVINAAPIATATSNSPVCENASLDLTGGPGSMVSYDWTGPNGFTSSTQSPTVNASATSAMAGTYTLIVDDGNCTNSTTTTVVVNPNATIALTSAAGTDAQTICDGSAITSITYSIGGGGTGATVSGLPTGVSGAFSGSTFTISGTPTQTGTFNYMVSTTGTCTQTSASGYIIINALPVATANNNGPVCAGQTLSLTGGDNGMTSYSWSGPNGFTSTSQNPTVSAASTAAMAGTYTITVNDGTCTNSETTIVTVNDLPVINAAGVSLNNPGSCGATDGSITGITATGTATLSYSWNAGAPQATADLSGIGSGSYTLVVTDGNSCTATDGPYSLSDPSSPPAPTLSLAAGPVCVGGSFTIDVVSPDGAATYTWSGPGGYSNTGTSITLSGITTAESGNYTAFASIGACVGASSLPINVTVNALPIADILPPNTVNCYNPVITLDGSNSEQGSISYAWSASNGGALLGSGNTDTESTSTAGDYELLVTNTTTGCFNSTSVSVAENLDTPSADITVNNAGVIDCAVTTINLDGTGSTNQAGGSSGIIYSWATSSGGATIDANSTTSVTSAGTYFLEVTETASGCTNETSVLVTDSRTTPTAVITGDATLTCTTTSITLDGTSSIGSSLSYEWQDGSSFTVGSSSTLAVIAPDTYTLIVTNTTNSCSNSTNVVISQDITVPLADAVSPLVVNCFDPVVTLDGTASDAGVNITYAWSNSGAGVIFGTADDKVDSTSTADTYTLTVTNTSNGCFDQVDVSVTMDTLSPIADAGTDVNFACGVTSVQLDGSNSSGSNISYDWSGPGVITNGTSATPEVDATGTFTLTVMDLNGCTDSDIVDVIPNINAPNADAGTDIVVTCNDLPWNVTLDGSASDSGANITYNWIVVSGNGTISNGTTVSPSVDEEGTYQITVTNTSNSCTATATVIVSTDTISPTAVSGNDDFITCNSGLVYTVDASSSVGSNLTYTWSTSNGTIDSQSGATAVVSDAGNYFVTVIGDNGCFGTDEIIIAMDTATPVISIAIPDSLDCLGSSIILDASATTGTNVSFTWSNSGSAATTTVNSSGIYTVTATNANGCQSSDNVEVFNVTGPAANISATPVTGDVPLAVSFTDASIGNGLTYSWEFGDGTTSIDQNPNYTYTTLNDFEVILTITDGNGCIDSDTIIISTTGETTLTIPNIFTPNGDGENDLFIIGSRYVLSAKGVIYNRWGQNIFLWNGLNNGWDGRNAVGKEVPEGVYYYIYEYEAIDGTSNVLTGFVQLIR